MILTRTTELHAEYPEYIWYPGVLANASWSSEHLAQRLHRHVAQKHNNGDGDGDHDDAVIDELKAWINEELVNEGEQ